jgi:hypothetical protein
MGGAPPKLDEVTRGIGVGLTGRTVGTYDDRGPRLDEVRHVSRLALHPLELFI